MASAYTLRPATDADYAWLYELNEATMRAYAEQTYGPWDEVVARRIFAERWQPAGMQILVVEGQDAGVLETRRTTGGLEIVQIKIGPVFQRRGLGAQVLSDVLRDAHRCGQSVTLRVLKVNPARRLYERLGFVVTGETPTHFLMAAQPALDP